MKTGTTIAILALAIVGILGAFLLGSGSSDLSTIGGEDEVSADAPWASKLVPVELLVADKYDSTATVNSTVKVYAEQPEDWNNPRGSFDESTLYTEYSGDSDDWDNIDVNRETPGMYYAVITSSGYNTEFVTFEVPDGSGMGDLSDYKSGVDVYEVEMTQVGSTTDEDFDFTLTNETSVDLSDTILLTVDEDTEFRGWKVIVDDTEGFSTDANNDGVYDEGISAYTVIFNGQSEEIFNPSNGIDEFDSNDEYEFMIEDVSVADKSKIDITVEIEAEETGDYTGADDEVWGEGEGTLSQIIVRDAEANLFATVEVTA